jgi:replicative DNA helicase
VNGLHAPDAEHSVLGGLLLDYKLIDAVELTPEDFPGMAERAVYRLMLERWGEGEPWA